MTGIKISVEKLIKTPFDLNNKGQQKALKILLDDFELQANKMIVFELMKRVRTLAPFSFLANYLPYVSSTYLSYTSVFVTIAVVGYGLEVNAQTDFDRSKKEMQDVYNWCLKEGNSNIDATLAHPGVERMIKLLAPHNEIETMVAWERITTPSKNTNNTGFFAWAGAKLDGAASYFVPGQKLDVPTRERVEALKKAVENGDFRKNIILDTCRDLETRCHALAGSFFSTCVRAAATRLQQEAVSARLAN